MGTTHLILALLCLAFIGRGNVFNGSVVTAHSSRGSFPTNRDRLSFHSLGMTEGVLKIARSEIGTKEATGNNDGKRVEQYLASVGLAKGQPYCAAFISWVFKEAGYPLPRTGWSPALFPKNRLVTRPAPANVFGIYFSSLKRVGHCGFVDCVKGDWIFSVEANTDPSGGRNGDGVYRRLRHVKTIHRFADWTIGQTKGAVP